MNSKKLLKNDKNNKIGEGREYLVSQFIKKRYKWQVEPSGFVDDVHNEIDLICKKKNETIVYIQVKGFHDNWKEERFNMIINKSIKDKALAYAMYVNKSGRIYVRKLL